MSDLVHKIEHAITESGSNFEESVEALSTVLEKLCKKQVALRETLHAEKLVHDAHGLDYLRF